MQINAEKKDDTVWNTCYLALEPMVGATLDEVCEDLKAQIYEYLNFFHDKVKTE